MKRILLLAMGALVCCSAPVSAAPNVFSHAWNESFTLDECFSRAKKVATVNGFTRDQEEVLDDDEKDGTFYAFNADKPFSLAVRCLPTAGIISVGVAGIGNQVTFDVYSKIVKEL